MKNINMLKNNKGQIAIIVLLVSAVMLTLGLSASKNAVTDLKVDTDEELLKEAFNTAESGINNYLDGGGTSYSSGGNNATVEKTDIGGNTSSLVSEGVVLAGTSQLFWLVDHDIDGKIGTNYYSSTSLNITVDSSFTKAIKIDYYSKSGSTYSVTRSGYNFGGTTVTGYPSSAPKTVSLNIGSNNALLLVVTPIGGSTNLKVSGTANFPVQGEELTSVGTVNNGVNTQVKTRNIYQIPTFLTEAIVARNIIQ